MSKLVHYLAACVHALLSTARCSVSARLADELAIRARARINGPESGACVAGDGSLLAAATLAILVACIQGKYALFSSARYMYDEQVCASQRTHTHTHTRTHTHTYWNTGSSDVQYQAQSQLDIHRTCETPQTPHRCDHPVIKGMMRYTVRSTKPANPYRRAAATAAGRGARTDRAAAG